MAFDHNFVPKDLRLLNVAPTEEPLISPLTVTSPPTPNSVPDFFYPPSVSTSAATGWYVRPVAHPVYNYGSSFGNRVVQRNAMNLGNWSGTNNNGLDKACNDSATVNVNGYSYGFVGGTRGIDEVGDDSMSGGRKVKFLCSFGGKILPRPSDGVLRYVGGQTRIINVRKDVIFNDLVKKMVDTYGQPVVIKYQLPEEDLDALVSVGCRDDVDNMMEEYEKLAERAPDGSTKLRVFLFPSSEVEVSGAAQLGDLQDTGQKYFDAVNGVADGIKKKESVTSAASTQNSDFSGIELFDSLNVGQVETESDMLSPRENSVASPDTIFESITTGYSGASPVSFGMPMAKTGPTHTSYIHNQAELEKSMHVSSSQQPFELKQSRLEIPPPSPYMHPFVDPRQGAMNHTDYVQLYPHTGFPNPQLLGKTEPVFTQQQFHDNTPGLAFHQVIPDAQMTMTQPSSPTGVRTNVIQPQPFMQPKQNCLDQYSNENKSGLRIIQLPAEHSYNTYQVPVSQVPSLVVEGNYGWVQFPPQEHVVYSDGLSPQQQVIIPEKIHRDGGCSMCQTKLPHAHSDPVVQDQHNSGSGSIPDSSPSYHSFSIEDNVKVQATNMDKLMVTTPLKEGVVEQRPGIRPRVNSKLEPIHEVAPCTDDFGLSHNLEPEHKGGQIFVQKLEELDHPNNPFVHETIGRTGGKQSHMDGLMAMGITPVSCPDDDVQQHMGPVETWVIHDGSAKQTSKCMVQGSPKEYPNEHTSVVSKSDAVDNWIRQGHLKSVDGRMDTLKICNPKVYVCNDQCLLPIDKPLDCNIQLAVEEEVILDNNIGKSKLIIDANQNKMKGVLSCSSTEISYDHNSKTKENNEVAQSPVMGIPQPKIGNHQKDYEAPSSSSPSVGFGNVQDYPNSLFSNQDPWNIQHGTFFSPSNNKDASENETYSHKDHFDGNPGSRGKQNLEAQLDDGFHQSFNHNLSFEHGQFAKGSTEDQQLQAVAEDVAASILHPCTPSNPDLHARDVSYHENIEDDDVQNNLIDVKCRDKTLDVKRKPPEKGNFGFPASGVGRLQVIKNCDLEELTELGSGTFGIVYHGKWRGTDVAIKRITDRCFAGKPSEQERMRHDFWNEAIKLADLHHPNVVAFYGVVLDGPGGSVATVTEYMANGSLRNALQKNERNLDKRRRLFIAMDVAFGMEYLHGKNIVHFDLKSDNLLVNLRDPHRPICKVGDLGLSKVKCQTLISGGVRGTLPWMAPELLNGSSSLVTEKVDVFSFGIVMWELLTGEEPYADLHYGAIIGGIVSNTLRPPVLDSYDPEWRLLMEKCWSSEPSERPTFTEIANELRSFAVKCQNQRLQPSLLHK